MERRAVKVAYVVAVLVAIALAVSASFKWG